MAGLTNLLAPVRLSARLVGGTLRVATAPARATIAAAEVAADLLAQLRSSPPPAPRPPGGTPADGPDAITPSIAPIPGGRRRRTQTRDPRQPVTTPGLPEEAEEPPREDSRAGTELLAGQPEDTADTNGDRAPERTRPAVPFGADTHVVVEKTLVAEVADPGSADGAGAQVHVSEPWPGYRTMKASEVVDRLPAQDEASLSVLLLFERSHRARKSVLAAAERELARRV